MGDAPREEGIEDAKRIMERLVKMPPDHKTTKPKDESKAKPKKEKPAK
jgi:hypothetical protein